MTTESTPKAGTPITIRPACPADAPAIAAIYAHHVIHGTATFDTVPRTPAETAAKIAQFAAPGWPYLVATRDGQILGYAYAAQFRDRPAYGFACENSVYLHPDHIGQGHGKVLLEALITAATAAGFRQMIAVIAGGEAASVALHTRAGFRHNGTMQAVGRKFGRWLDTIYMQLALGAGDSEAPAREPE